MCHQSPPSRVQSIGPGLGLAPSLGRLHRADCTPSSRHLGAAAGTSQALTQASCQEALQASRFRCRYYRVSAFWKPCTWLPYLAQWGERLGVVGPALIIGDRGRDVRGGVPWAKWSNAPDHGCVVAQRPRQRLPATRARQLAERGSNACGLYCVLHCDGMRLGPEPAGAPGGIERRSAQ